MQEMPDIHKTGEKKFYPKVRHLSCLSNDFIMKAFMETTMMKRSAFEGVLRGLPEVTSSNPLNEISRSMGERSMGKV